MGVFAHAYDSSGTSQGDEFQVNTTTVGTQSNASIAIMPYGDFVIVWGGNGPGDDNGVFAAICGPFGLGPP